MTKADTAKLITIIVMAYPNFDKFKDDEHVKGVVTMWATMFADDDPGLVGLAVRKHISTNKWPPSVAEIREIMVEIQRPDLIPPDQAWGAVEDVLESRSEYSHERPRLPEMILRAVENIGGFSTIRNMRREASWGGKAGMDRVAFLQTYTPMYEREKSRAMCGRALQSSIDDVTKKIDTGARAMLADATNTRRKKEAEMARLENRWVRDMLPENTNDGERGARCESREI